jgi:hypothetical protein
VTQLGNLHLQMSLLFLGKVLTQTRSALSSPSRRQTRRCAPNLFERLLPYSISFLIRFVTWPLARLESAVRRASVAPSYRYHVPAVCVHVYCIAAEYRTSAACAPSPPSLPRYPPLLFHINIGVRSPPAQVSIPPSAPTQPDAALALARSLARCLRLATRGCSYAAKSSNGLQNQTRVRIFTTPT